MSKKKATKAIPPDKATLEPVGPETSSCGTTRVSEDFSISWLCVAENCDGVQHYFRRLMWIGPFLTGEVAVAQELADTIESNAS